MNKIYTFKYKMLFLILIFSIFISGCNNGPDKEESNTSEVSNIEESDAPKAPDVVEDIVSDEWKDKYIDKISEDIELGDPASNNYRLVDIDGIHPPELYVNGCCEAAGAKILSYYEDSVIEQHLSRLNGLIYEPGTGTFINENGNMGYYYDNIYTLKDGQFSNIYNGEFNCGDADGKGPIFDEDTGEIIYIYYWEDVEVSREEYKNKLSEYIMNPHIISEEDEYTLDEIIVMIENY